MRDCARVVRWGVLPLALVIAGCEAPAESEPASGCAPGADVCGPGRLLLGCGECIAAGEMSIDLDACAAGVPADVLEAELSVSAAFVGTFPGLAVASDVPGDFGVRVALALDTLARAPDESALPPGFTFSGGVYTSTNAPVEIRAAFGEDYQAGEEGDPIVPSLFETESYLTGAEVTLSDDGSAKVAFSGTGPLVELLGLGPTPPNPFVLGVFDAPAEMKSQWLTTRALAMYVRGCHDGTCATQEAGVTYGVEWVAEALTERFGGEVETEAASEASGFKAFGADGQSAEISAWEIGIVNRAYVKSLLRGRAELTVTGGRVPHVTTVVFDGASSLPSVFVRCP